jgi:hypothetical protein
MTTENKQTLADLFKELEDNLLKEEEDFWNSMSKEDQLKAFCAVIRRLHKGEIVDGRSYRGVLYGTFGFAEEAYMRAQFAGFLDIHNALDTGD